MTQRLGDLSPQALRAALQGDGLRLVCGPFVYRIRSPFVTVAEGLALLYSGHPVAGVDDFVDFDLAVERTWRPRRGWMAQFQFEGETPFELMVAAHAFPLLEWAMNWCVAANVKHHLLLHAAVLERDGQALVLPAPPGSGKSTLCAGLMYSGWRLLTDEMALIPLDGEAPRVLPLCRAVSLKNQSIGIIQGFAPQAVFNAPCTDTVKGVVSHARPLAEHVARMAEPARPAWVVFPQYQAGAALTPTQLARPATMLDMIDQSFNYGQLGLPAFRALSDLMAQSACLHLRYGSLADALRGVEELSRA